MNGPLPRAFGEPVLAARIRSDPEDFLVEEIPAFEPHGEGEHLLLTIEKRGLTTSEAARRLATWAGLREMAIGYAGMKDRHAVTRQRFSVHLPKRVSPDVATLQAGDLSVLQAVWHNRKLPRGALRGDAAAGCAGLRPRRLGRTACGARAGEAEDRGMGGGVPEWPISTAWGRLSGEGGDDLRCVHGAGSAFRMVTW